MPRSFMVRKSPVVPRVSNKVITAPVKHYKSHMTDSILFNLFGKTGRVPASKRYACRKCEKQYSSSSNLKRHEQTHLPRKYAKKCPYCEKAYVSVPAFTQHVRTHKPDFICKECNKKCSRFWLLQVHTRTHSKEKPFVCGYCTKAFSHKSSMTLHSRTHFPKMRPDQNGSLDCFTNGSSRPG